VTKSQYYTKRAAECLLASAQIPSDRDVLLHMASVYIQIAPWPHSRPLRRLHLVSLIGKLNPLLRHG
jgi:hypothetical protein